jgi:hypothetical protein
MTMSDAIMILAVLAGPVVAVQVQKFIETRRDKKLRKLRIFKTLMTTRGTPVSVPHVEELNMIDIEFENRDRVEKDVIIAWKVLLDHFSSGPQDQADPQFQAKLASWSERGKELHATLLHKMAIAVGYDFDEVHLKKAVYCPHGHGQAEMQQLFIRDSLVDLFLGKKSLPIWVAGVTRPGEQMQAEGTNKAEQESGHVHQ